LDTQSAVQEKQLTGKLAFDSTYLLLVLVPIFWGGAFVAAKFVVHELPPFTVATIRFALATLCLLPLIYYQEKEKIRLQKEDLLGMLVLGLTGIFGYNALFFCGLQFTSATNGSLIIATNPIITFLLSAVFLKEQISWKKALGIVISFTGVTFVITNGNLTHILEANYNIGDLMLMGAPLCWAIYSIVGKGILKKYSPLASTTYACGFGTLMLLPFSLYELTQKGFAIVGQTSFLGWLAIVYMAVFASVLGFVWWYKGVEKIGASRTSIFTNLVPVSAVVLAALLLGEQITGGDILGAGLVISGVYLTTKK